MNAAIALCREAAAGASSALAGSSRALLGLLAPRRCLACTEPLDAARARRLCDACLESIDRLSFEGLPCCPSCGLPTGPAELHAVATRCGECVARAPVFEAARSFGLYDGALRDAILRLKFAGQPALAGPLGALLARAAEGLPRPDAIVAVPMHATRLRERGFNQAAMLARVAAKALGVPRLPRALVRTTATGPQTARDRARRFANVRGAMTADAAQVRGLSILLVDDVLTTGATVTACAEALLDAGAASVRVATVARTALGEGGSATIDGP